MRQLCKKGLSALLVLALLAGFVLIAPAAVRADHFTSYSTVAVIYNTDYTYSMQGGCVDDTYFYCAKINDAGSSASIARTTLSNGTVTWLTNAATGTKYFSQLGHANDLDVHDINGVKTIFAVTSGDGPSGYQIVRFSLSGTTLTQVGYYDTNYNGKSQLLASAVVMSVEGDTINLICKANKYIYTGTMGVNQTSGTIDLELLCTLDYANTTMNGKTYDLSGYVNQGFDYYDGRIYVPLCEPNNMVTSVILAYDVIGVSGAVRNNPIFSTSITSSTFADLFEVESCAICPSDGIMYFNTNRRKSSSDANHDGVHRLTGFTYDAGKGDSTRVVNHRFEVANDRLRSVTTDGAVYNHAQLITGNISSGAISKGHYSLDRNVVLKHTDPWVIEWKESARTSNTLMLSNQFKSAYEGNTYIYIRKDGLVSFGTYTDGGYYNYGINITTSHSINTSSAHTYRLTNKIASDGTNMVYLSVDGKELGAMNQYFVGGTAQNTTNNWLSGKDFAFNYLGTSQHSLASSLSYLKIWGEGIPGQVDEPDNFRWETRNNKLTTVEDFDLTTNAATVVRGSISGTTYTDYYARLDKEVTLLHDRPWAVEWYSDNWSSGGMVLSTAYGSYTYGAPFLFHTGIVALGAWNGTKFDNYGVSLNDHGIDRTVGHTYRLQNRVNADGSNMVYLYVDGEELGPMNGHYLGTTAQNTTSNWVSGKDFSFSYVGNGPHDISGNNLSYIQVWEDGEPEDHTGGRYRWEPSGGKLVSAAGYDDNTPTMMGGSISGTAFTGTWFRLEEPVVLRHDRTWTMQWESEGSWVDASNGGMLLAGSRLRNELNAPYLYRRGKSELIAFGVRGSNNHYNYGISLSAHGIDGTAKHTYLLQNRVNADGSNMIYLSVDGKELGAMNQYFVGGTAQNTTDNWVSGKDFVFYYLGNSQFTIGNCNLSYLQIEGSCDHVYSDWDVTAATCVTNGSRTRSCTLCGITQTETVAATGHSYQLTVVAPTCITDGYTVHSCTVCGNTYQSDTTVATGHSYTAKVTAPTCDQGGYTTYTCTVCGDNYKGSYVSATGHSYQTTVVAPTCTASGYTAYTCVLCGDSFHSDSVAATGHSYRGAVTDPTCTAGGYTTYTCSTCGYSYQDNLTAPTDHSYENGSCTVCGEEDPNAVTKPTLGLRYPTVSFEDEIVMNVYLTVDNWDSIMELGLITYSSKVTDYGVDTAEQVVPGYSYNPSNGLIGVKTGGIPAKCLGDVIYFSVYAQLTDGSYVYSSLVGYNPKTYAYSQLTSGTAEMKALVVAMLNYGAAAQNYFGYKTDTLVNADLTAAQKALVSDYNSTMMETVVQADSSKLGIFTNAKQYNKRYPSISFEGAFCINYYFQPSLTLDGSVTMYLWSREDFNAATVLTKENATRAITMELTSTGEYLAVVEGIAAKDLDKAVYVSFVYSDGTTEYASGVIGYSIGAYCNSQASKTDTFGDLAKATAVYGYYAKQAFYQ